MAQTWEPGSRVAHYASADLRLTHILIFQVNTPFEKLEPNPAAQRKTRNAFLKKICSEK